MRIQKLYFLVWFSTFLLSFLLIFGISTVHAVEETPTPTEEPTATPTLENLMILQGTPEPKDYTCPNYIQGYGVVTPSAKWLLYCSDCLNDVKLEETLQANPTDYFNGKPPVKKTATPEGYIPPTETPEGYIAPTPTPEYEFDVYGDYEWRMINNPLSIWVNGNYREWTFGAECPAGWDTKGALFLYNIPGVSLSWWPGGVEGGTTRYGLKGHGLIIGSVYPWDSYNNTLLKNYYNSKNGTSWGQMTYHKSWDADGNHLISIGNTIYTGNYGGVMEDSVIVCTRLKQPITEPTPTPILTPTQSTNGYCSQIEPEGEPENVMEYPSFKVGAKTCHTFGGQTIDFANVNWLPGINIPTVEVPSFQVCVQSIFFGKLSIIGLEVDLDALAGLIGSIALLRWFMRS